MPHSLALDCGGSGVRLVDVGLDQGRVSVYEAARMSHAPIRAGDRLLWDYDRIFAFLDQALTERGASGTEYDSIGVDSWGVDYVLLGADDKPVEAPFCYRDARTRGLVDRYARDFLSPQHLFAKTGIPSLEINTLYQLYAQKLKDPSVLKRSKSLLLTADYLHFWLSGVHSNEHTLASTTQMLGLDGQWSKAILAALELPEGALRPPCRPGTILGPLRKDLGRQKGLSGLRVIVPAAHDTASAIMAVPAPADEDWAYISSGTWSLIGALSPVPCVSPEARAAGLGNEGGYGAYCLHATVTGLWIVQEILRQLGEGWDDARLAAEAAQAVPFRSLINPADARFFSPVNMIGAVQDACRAIGEPTPETPAALGRCAYDSLALLYRRMLAVLARATGRTFARLHIVGGGSKAALLNDLCASACGIPVYAGPSEATALGNALAQWIALGHVASLEEGRALVGRSFPPFCHPPIALPGVAEAIGRFDRFFSS